LPQSAVFNAFSVLGIPTGDTQNTRDLGTGVPKTRGYPNHCDTANGELNTTADLVEEGWGEVAVAMQSRENSVKIRARRQVIEESFYLQGSKFRKCNAAAVIQSYEKGNLVAL